VFSRVQASPERYVPPALKIARRMQDPSHQRLVTVITLHERMSRGAYKTVSIADLARMCDRQASEIGISSCRFAQLRWSGTISCGIKTEKRCINVMSEKFFVQDKTSMFCQVQGVEQVDSIREWVSHPSVVSQSCSRSLNVPRRHNSTRVQHVKLAEKDDLAW
jgi:hypothetical protein